MTVAQSGSTFSPFRFPTSGHTFTQGPLKDDHLLLLAIW